jgi:hypothetical protein
MTLRFFLAALFGLAVRGAAEKNGKHRDDACAV